MITALIYALLSPLFYAGVNVYDKYVVEHRVKNPLSYVIIDGTAIFLASIMISLFLNWSNVTLEAISIPLINGLISGFATWAYYYLIIREDVSHITGIIYTYPILVALFSFLFLNEVIPLIGYAGMMITITGVVMLSNRLKKLNKNTIIALSILVLIIAVTEILVKLATTRIEPLNGIVISGGITGAIMIAGLCVSKIRKHVKGEIRNLPIAGGGTILFYGGAFTLFMAMIYLPATIVASIAAIQPLVVLTMEKIVDKTLGKISKDTSILPKLGAITLIVMGVVLIYIAELIRT